MHVTTIKKAHPGTELGTEHSTKDEALHLLKGTGKWAEDGLKYPEPRALLRGSIDQ